MKLSKAKAAAEPELPDPSAAISRLTSTEPAALPPGFLAPISTTEIDVPEGFKPMSAAPTGQIVLLIGKDTGGHAVRGIFQKTRRWGGGKNRWQPISFWADPVTRRSLGFEPIGWKEWGL